MKTNVDQISKKYQSNKFYLRYFHPDDADELYKALHDKRVVKHMASEGFTLDTCKQIIEKSNKHWNQYQIGDYAVVNKYSNEIIGWAGFKFWQDNQFEIVLVLSPSYWGLGHPIYQELIRQAKHDFGLKEVYVLLPKTRRSFRSIEKLGFAFLEMAEFNGEPFMKFVRCL